MTVIAAQSVKGYELLDLIGEGSYGAVYRAQQPLVDRQVAIKIIPFLVMILVAIGMFRASGAFDLMVSALRPITSIIGMPADALPMALMRPLSGSGAFGVMSEVVSRDPNSFSSFLVSTMQGSTETTFYVLAVYFGAIGVFRPRHAVPAALFADATGILVSLGICHLMF